MADIIPVGASSSAAGQRRRVRVRRPSTGKTGAPPATFGSASQTKTWSDSCDSAIDLGLLGAVTLVPMALGGRSGPGLFVMALCATWSVGWWIIREVFATERNWHPTGVVWFWSAALGLLVLQLSPLPLEWLTTLSPPLKTLLPMWDGSQGAPLWKETWRTLSLAPHETRSSLATCLCYALLFWVGTQRFRTVADITRWLQWCGAITVAMALFALAQYLFSNEKFYWVFQHHILGTSTATQGSFPCRNHLAQFLSLGVGPLLLTAVLQQPHRTAAPHPGTKSSPRTGFQRSGEERWTLLSLCWLVGLGIVLLAALLTQSRGGALANAVALLSALWLLNRLQWISTKFLLSLVVLMGLFGGLFTLYGYERLSKRLDEQGNAERFLIWETNLKVILDFPLVGTGVGSHRNAHHLHFDAPDLGHEYADAESGYLQIASEAGAAGVLLLLIAIVSVMFWCATAIRHPDNAIIRGAGAAVLASVLASLAQSVADFVWYMPGCMTPLVLLCAVARRASQLSAAASLETEATPAWPPGPLRYVVLGSPLVVAGVWSSLFFWPLCKAEFPWRTYQGLAYLPQEFEEGSIELLKQKTVALQQTVRANPSDARAHELLSLCYLRWFDHHQQTAEIALPLAEVRDAAMASEFKSATEGRAWVKQVTGTNYRYLLAAIKHARQAVRVSPLEGPGYLLLADLSFLIEPDGDLPARLQNQAQRVRPFNPLVLYAAGQAKLASDDLPGAIACWQRPFHRNKKLQAAILRGLAPALTPAEMVEKFQPALEDFTELVLVYRELGTETQMTEALDLLIAAARERATSTIGHASESAWMTARNTCHALEQVDRGISLLQEGIEMHPFSLELRQTLGTDLFHRHQFTEAAVHLSWCAERRPEDATLRDLAADATKRGLAATSSDQSPMLQLPLETEPSPRQERVVPAGFQR